MSIACAPSFDSYAIRSPPSKLPINVGGPGSLCLSTRNAAQRNPTYELCSFCLRVCGRYEDGSFDAVVDKGTLDALMSEDTAQVRESGKAMLAEVKRVLKPAGRSVVFSAVLRCVF